MKLVRNNHCQPEPSSWTHLFFLIWTLVLVAILPDERVGFLAGIVLLFILLTGSQGLFTLSDRRLWIGMLLLLAISAFVLGKADWHWGMLQLSLSGLQTGLCMALRALCLTLAFGGSSSVLSASEMSRLFDSLGLKGLGFALGVALNAITPLGEVVHIAYHSCRLRGGFRRHLWLNTRRLLISALTNAIRYGDDVVLAASARAFDPSRHRVIPPAFHFTDLVILLTLIVLGGLLVA